MTGFGIELLTMTVVGEAFVSAAESPGAQPGKPPEGVHRPAVVVQFAVGGGALAVTVYAVGTQMANAVATPRMAMAANEISAERTRMRRRASRVNWRAASLRICSTDIVLSPRVVPKLCDVTRLPRGRRVARESCVTIAA